MDLENAVDYYSANGGPQVAMAFLDEFDTKRAFICLFPALGAALTEPSTGKRRVRRIRFLRFPWSMLYAIESNCLTILRVVHDSQEMSPLRAELELE